MTANQFVAWMACMRFDDEQAMNALGLSSIFIVSRYRAGGAPAYIALACAALVAGIEPWQP